VIFDDELKQLTQQVRDTFGPEAWEDARDRALTRMTMALPDDLPEHPFDGSAAFRDALKADLRRLLHRH